MTPMDIYQSGIVLKELRLCFDPRNQRPIVLAKAANDKIYNITEATALFDKDKFTERLKEQEQKEKDSKSK